MIPSSVLGGGILLLLVGVYRLATGADLFETEFFGGNGTANLELITYHTLALGFIASAFKSSGGKLPKHMRKMMGKGGKGFPGMGGLGGMGGGMPMM